MKFFRFLFFSLSLASVSLAGPGALPYGISALILPGTGPIDSSILADSRVPIVSIGIFWDVAEPTTQGVYDFSSLDPLIAQATTAGKKIILRCSGVGGSHVRGGTMPNHLFSAIGATATDTTATPGITVAFTNGSTPVVIPVWWNSIYLARKVALINAMGAHVKTLSSAQQNAIKIFVVAYANSLTDDFNISYDNITDLTNTVEDGGAGYTTDNMILAGTTLIDAAMSAFPNCYISTAVGPNGTSLDSQHAIDNNDTDVRNHLSRWVTTQEGLKWGTMRLICQRNSMSAIVPRAPAGGNTNSDYNWKLIQEKASLGRNTGSQTNWHAYADSGYKVNGGDNCDKDNPSCVTPCSGVCALSDDQVLERAYDRANGYNNAFFETYSIDVLHLSAAMDYGFNIFVPGSRLNGKSRQSIVSRRRF